MRIRPFSAALLGGVLALSSCSSGGERPVWADEFESAGRPDPAVWSPEVGMLRNQELQWYQPDNATVGDGLLTIQARREQHGGAAYTSSSLRARGDRAFRYGRVEVRARIDARSGLWPAIWLLGDDIEKVGWPACGEIDMLEYYKDGILANVAHGDGPVWDTERIPLSQFTAQDPDWSSKFHVWRMDWNENSIQLHLDDALVNDFDVNSATRPDGTNPFREKMFLLLNLAIGGINGGDPSDTAFPARFDVDYVRVYR